MIHTALLAAVLTLTAGDAAAAPKTAVHQCFEAMDGAVYHGDPSDGALMRANVAACERGVGQIQRMQPGAAQGPEKLFLIGRILDRAATLSFMGLNDAATALREVKTANLYFRIASGLPHQSATYRAAALQNVTLTNVQLNTLNAEIAAAKPLHVPAIATLMSGKKQTLAHRMSDAAYTAYRHP